MYVWPAPCAPSRSHYFDNHTKCPFLGNRALIDFFRRGALPSRVLYELIWLVLFWVMHLGEPSSLSKPLVTNVSSWRMDTHRSTPRFTSIIITQREHQRSPRPLNVPLMTRANPYSTLSSYLPGLLCLSVRGIFYVSFCFPIL